MRIFVALVLALGIFIHSKPAVILLKKDNTIYSCAFHGYSENKIYALCKFSVVITDKFVVEYIRKEN